MQPKRRNQLIIATFIIAVSIGIAAVGIPQLPHGNPPTGTLASPVNRQVGAGTTAAPGFFALQLTPPLQAERIFSVGVAVINSTLGARFCILTDQQYLSWQATTTTQNYGYNFPWNYCKAQAGPTTQTILTFTPPSSLTWDVVVINDNSVPINVKFSPVP